jgi:aconitate hydratase/homoaconitate hydratase
VAAWLLRRRRGYNDAARYYKADDAAPYIARYPIDLGSLAPQIAKPFSPDNVFAVDELIGQELDGCFVGACTTTEEELALAALVLERALADGAEPQPVESGRRIVVPGDLMIQKRFQDLGLWEIYERAGFIVDPPNCSMCLGIASRKAGKGEVWLSSQNRNFENRMGEGSLAWLASAATVAASAFSMRVSDPRPLLDRIDRDRLDTILQRQRNAPPVEITITEPEIALAVPRAGTGRQGSAGGVIHAQVQRFGDSVDTDAIIPGEFCHLTDLTALGEKTFYYVRPEFRQRAKDGATIVVAGEGWGSGSSREMAVWALQGIGIQAVIAKSFAFIHKRNLVNEALPYLVIRDEAFYDLATEGAELEVDLASGVVRDVASGREFQAQTPTPMIQALTAEGGLVQAIQTHGKDVFAALTA